MQRRNQKLVEETPSPAVSPELRARLLAAAVTRRRGGRLPQRRHRRVPARPGHRRVLLPGDEHPAAGRAPDHRAGLRHRPGRGAAADRRRPGARPSTRRRWRRSGHAIELRINAEDPKRFLPGPGAVTTWVEPTGEGVRVDSGYAAGTTVTPFYDSLMAKLIVHGADRADAIARARAAVAGFEIAGPKNNLPFFAELLENAEFLSGDYDTGIVGRMRLATAGVAVRLVSIREVGAARRAAERGPGPDRREGRLLDALSGHRCRGASRRSRSCTRRRSRRWPTPTRCGRRAARNPDVRYSALVPNTRGASGRSTPGSPRSRWWSRPATRTTGATSTGRPTSRSTTSPRLIPLLHDAGATARGDRRDQLRLPVRGGHRPAAGGRHRRPGPRRRRRPDRVRRHHRHGHPAPGP